MIKCFRPLCGVLLTLLMFCVPMLFGAVPQMINYQGRLTTPVGTPINDTMNLVFAICNDSLCSSQLWTESRSNVAIKEGLFDVMLGSVNPIPGVVFDGSIRFLSISMNGTPVTRRLPIVSVGYAFKAISADTAAYAKMTGGDVDCSDCDNEFVNAVGPDSVRVKVGTAFLGRSVGSSTGASIGVEGYVSNPSSGAIYGGYFHTDDAGSGQHVGAYGGAWGSTTQDVYGLYGYGSNSSGGMASGGNFVSSNAGTGVHYGLNALANSATPSGAYGIYAEGANISSGSAVGGAFTTNTDGSGAHYAVFADANAASTSTTYGIYSDASNTSTGTAYGGYFRSVSSGTGTHYAVRGVSYGGSSNDTYGSYMYAQNTSAGDVLGGYFEVGQQGTGSHTAVSGKAYHSDDTSPSIGVYGYAENSGEGDAYGGYFSAPGLDDGVDYALYASAPVDTGSITYAGFFDGVVAVQGYFSVNGLKSAAVKISGDEYRALYCQESPENWFEDFGEGQLQNGHTHIELDPVFLETVTIDAQHPMKVFVQLEGDCNGVYVEKGTTGFDVSELKGGNSNASFSYRIVAKRKGYEDLRLAKLEGFAPKKMRAAGDKIEAAAIRNQAQMEAENQQAEKQMQVSKKKPAPSNEE